MDSREAGLRAQRQEIWNLAKDALEAWDFRRYEHYQELLRQYDSELKGYRVSYFNTEERELLRKIDQGGAGGTFTSTVHYNNGDPLWEPSTGTWVDVTALGDRNPTYILHNNPTDLEWIEKTPDPYSDPKYQQLKSYNEIYDRNVDFYHGPSGVSGYTFWRKEFEATGAEFAKEQMLVAYKRGDEETWEQSLRQAPKSKDLWAASRKAEIIAFVIFWAVIVLLGFLL